ncbi:hypothetical protein HN51_050275 [Arachis hypogaea]
MKIGEGVMELDAAKLRGGHGEVDAEGWWRRGRIRQRRPANWHLLRGNFSDFGFLAAGESSSPLFSRSLRSNLPVSTVVMLRDAGIIVGKRWVQSRRWHSGVYGMEFE